MQLLTGQAADEHSEHATDYPRFVSRVYWHFTGSPENCEWSKYHSPDEMRADGIKPKSPQKCANIASQILESGKLIAKCTEFKGGDKFCSITDIPLKDLPFHSTFYGKVAIGFSAESVQRVFSPVMYVGDDSHFRSIDKVFEKYGLDFDGEQKQEFLNATPFDKAQTVLDCVKAGHQVGGGVGALLAFFVGAAIVDEAKPIPRLPTEDAVRNQQIAKQLLTLLSFCKKTRFSPKPLGTFYLEREWRCMGDFTFSPADVESVICPAFYMKELSAKCSEVECNASIIAWETLERI